MKTINVINYLEIFSNRFDKVSRKAFLKDYEFMINSCSFALLTNDTASGNPTNNFFEKWKENFKDREDLLRDLFFCSPKKVYALLELVE